MDRGKLRRFADGLALMAGLFGVGRYLVEEKLLGQDSGGLAVVGAVIVLALIISWVLRLLSGMTWREALWPRPEPPAWRKAPPSMALVKELAEAGQRIQAIVVYREMTGADLQVSYDAVNAMHPK